MVWHAFGRQLQNPRGTAGRLTGILMRWVNSGPNQLAVDALKIAPRDTVLELGVGPGHGIALMAARASAGLVYGVDQSATMLEQSAKRNRAAIRSGRVLLRLATFESLPFADASIDKILAVNVAYFWRDPLLVMSEIRRVLRPHGQMAVYVTDAATMRHWKFAGEATHQHYDAITLTKMLQLGGFPSEHIAVEEIQMGGGVQGLLAAVGDRNVKY